MRNFQYLLYLPKHRFLFKYCYIKDVWYQLRHNNNSMLGKIIFASLLATCIFVCAHAVPISVSNWNNIFFLFKSCIIYQYNFTKLRKGYSFKCPSSFIYFLNWRKHKLKLEYLENKPCAIIIRWCIEKSFNFQGNDLKSMQEDLIEVERALLRLGGQTDPEAPIPNVCIRCHFKYAVFS